MNIGLCTGKTDHFDWNILTYRVINTARQSCLAWMNIFMYGQHSSNRKFSQYIICVWKYSFSLFESVSLDIKRTKKYITCWYYSHLIFCYIIFFYWLTAISVVVLVKAIVEAMSENREILRVFYQIISSDLKVINISPFLLHQIF